MKPPHHFRSGWESLWHDIVSGRASGIGATIARAGLAMASPLHAAGSALRNWAYDGNRLPCEMLPVPVISVGNLTAGGTGKTPTVAWIAHLLQSLGYRPGIISRGYGADQSGHNDEKRLLDRLLPGVPHEQHADRRVAAAQLLARDPGTRPDLLILDDAFQHRRVARDFDLVLVDCLNPWGYGYQFPRGILRESLSGLRRASAVLLTRADQVDTATLDAIRGRLSQLTSAAIFVSHFEPVGLIDHAGTVAPLPDWYGREVAGFCAIGNPAGFRRTLVACGYALPDVRFRTYPDHHPYSAEELDELGDWARSYGAECLLTTAKDLVKIPMATIRNLPVRAVEIALRLDHEADEVALLESLRRGLSQREERGAASSGSD